MRFFTSFILVFGFIFVVACSSTITKNTEVPPNFILILSDDQGWNGTSVQMMDDLPQSKSDYHETPN